MAVVDCGSFAKAAEAMFISSPALIKQINILERDLGVELLARTNKGVEMTPAGEYVYRYACGAIARGRKAIEEARRLGRGDADEPTVRLGISPLASGRLVIDAWNAIKSDHGDIRVVIVQIRDNIHEWMRQINSIGVDADVLALIEPGHAHILNENVVIQPIYRAQIMCALPTSHELCSKSMIGFDDLRGEAIRVVAKGWTPAADAIRSVVDQRYPDITLLDFDPYDIDHLNKIASDGEIALIDSEWRDIYPFFTYIPLDTDYYDNVCLVYNKDCSVSVRAFVTEVAARLDNSNSTLRD